MVREELRLYNPQYCQRPHLVALNKADLVAGPGRCEALAAELAAFAARLQARPLLGLWGPCCRAGRPCCPPAGAAPVWLSGALQARPLSGFWGVGHCGALAAEWAIFAACLQARPPLVQR